MTLNDAVRAGSAVARNPVRIQPCPPCDTVIATGRFVCRRRLTADRRASSKVRLETSRYRPSTNRRRPAVQPAGSTPAETGRAYRLCSRIQAKYRRWLLVLWSLGAPHDVAHDLDAGRGAPQPRALRGEGALPVQAHAPGPRERPPRTPPRTISQRSPAAGRPRSGAGPARPRCPARTGAAAKPSSGHAAPNSADRAAAGKASCRSGGSTRNGKAPSGRQQAKRHDGPDHDDRAPQAPAIAAGPTGAPSCRRSSTRSRAGWPPAHATGATTMKMTAATALMTSREDVLEAVEALQVIGRPGWPAARSG